VNLAPGQRLRTRHAGAFLFLPLLASADFGRIVEEAGYPGTARVPARSAVLALLLLKLLDKERLSHIDDFNFDPALGLFAGLNVLPKRSFATEYPYRSARPNQRALLSAWVKALAARLFPGGRDFSIDFHTIPSRGDPDSLERHHVPLAGRARPCVLAFFALEQGSRVLCYSNANLVRAEQAGEAMRFVEFWRGLSGSDPSWLMLDSRVTTYPELSRINARGIRFVTIRRRGAAAIKKLRGLPGRAWSRAVVDTPKRSHQAIRYVEEWVSLCGYEGQARQVAVDGLGREKPTLILTNDREETARNLVIRYARRNRIEDGLGSAVDFFHLDCLSSEVRLNADLGAALTVVAHGCYRWLASRLKGWEKGKPKNLFRRFVEAAGEVEVVGDRLAVRFARRSHNPVLREAALDRDAMPIPWLGDRKIQFEYD
jgi:hypothetical protein